MPVRPCQPIDASCSAGERLGGQHVVVDRHGVQPQPRQQRPERVGGQHHPLRGHRARGSPHRHPAAPGRHVLDSGSLRDPDAERLGGVCEPPREAGGVHERAAVGVHPAGEVRRRVHQLPHRVGAQEARLVGRQAGHLVLARGHRQHAVDAEVAVDPVALHGRGDPREVLPAQAVEQRVLVGPPLAAVGLAVGEAGLAEAAVAPGRVLGEPVGLQQQDPPVGIALLGPHCRPQAREAATDHDEVGLDVAVERWARRRPGRRVQPEGQGRGVVELRVDLCAAPRRVGHGWNLLGYRLP